MKSKISSKFKDRIYFNLFNNIIDHRFKVLQMKILFLTLIFDKKSRSSIPKIILILENHFQCKLEKKDNSFKALCQIFSKINSLNFKNLHRVLYSLKVIESLLFG